MYIDNQYLTYYTLDDKRIPLAQIVRKLGQCLQQYEGKKEATSEAVLIKTNDKHVYCFITDNYDVLIKMFLNISLDNLPAVAHWKPLPYDQALKDAENLSRSLVGKRLGDEFRKKQEMLRGLRAPLR